MCSSDLTYGTPDPDWDTDELDEGEFRLSAVLPFVESKMRFDYDFGDGWVHNVVVEAINPVEAAVLYPRCLAGKRACPPEDCGGVPGYANILEVIADPNNPAHADLRDFVPLDYDPEHFDLTEMDVDMRSERPLEAGESLFWNSGTRFCLLFEICSDCWNTGYDTCTKHAHTGIAER